MTRDMAKQANNWMMGKTPGNASLDTRDITPKRVTSGGDYFRSTVASQRWRAVDDTMSDLTGLEIASQTCRIISYVLID